MTDDRLPPRERPEVAAPSDLAETARAIAQEIIDDLGLGYVRTQRLLINRAADIVARHFAASLAREAALRSAVEPFAKMGLYMQTAGVLKRNKPEDIGIFSPQSNVEDLPRLTVKHLFDARDAAASTDDAALRCVREMQDAAKALLDTSPHDALSTQAQRGGLRKALEAAARLFGRVKP